MRDVNALQIGVKTVLDQGRHGEHTFPPPGDGKEVSAKAAEALENLALQIKSMPEVEELDRFDVRPLSVCCSRVSEYAAVQRRAKFPRVATPEGGCR